MTKVGQGTWAHGHAVGNAESRTYVSWKAMKKRCTNKNYRQFHLYGGRGIKICDRWYSFANFLADMGERPMSMTLDRINSNGNYEPSNCRWATDKEQNRNASNARHVTIAGRTQCLAAWTEETGVSQTTIFRRMKRGLPENLWLHKGRIPT